MFEHRQAAVNQLLGENIEFRRLYNKHQELHKKVQEAETGIRAMDDMSLAKLKKQKLWHKDRLNQILIETSEAQTAH